MAGPSSTVTKLNLLAGPGSLYFGDLDATLPLDTAVKDAPDSDDFTDAGGTKDGLTVTVNQEFFALEVDQIADEVDHRMTKRQVQVKTNLAEGTLENLKLALNGGVISTGGTGATAFKKYALIPGQAAMFPDGKIIIVDGWAPGGNKRRRVICKDVISIDNIESAYKKDDQWVYPVTFSARYVDDTTSPVDWVDEVGA